MDKATYLVLLLGGQLTLLALDLMDGLRRPVRTAATAGIRMRTVTFILTTLVIYNGLQFGGLALVPTIEEVVNGSRALFGDRAGSGHGAELGAFWGVAPIFVAAFYFGGLCDYLVHRFVSHSRLFWFTHENHHLPTNVNLYMPGIFGRPFAVVAILPTMAASVLVLQLALSVSGQGGIDVMPFLYVAILVQVGIGCMSHSAYLRRFWWLHQLLKQFGLTTPQEHWLHHASALDGNYGNFTTIWDRVFGTYLDPEVIRSRDYRAGLEYDQDFLGTLTFGKLKLSPAVRRSFRLERFCNLEPNAAPEPPVSSAVQSGLQSP